MLAVTRGTRVGHAHLKAAEMTEQKSFLVRSSLGVVVERYRAIRAGQSLTAGSAGHRGVIPPSVQKEHRLLSSLRRLLHLFLEEQTYGRSVPLSLLVSHIVYLDLGQNGIAVPLGQFQKLVFSLASLGKALDRRSRARQKHDRLIVSATESRDIPCVIFR